MARKVRKIKGSFSEVRFQCCFTVPNWNTRNKQSPGRSTACCCDCESLLSESHASEAQVIELVATFGDDLVLIDPNVAVAGEDVDVGA